MTQIMHAMSMTHLTYIMHSVCEMEWTGIVRRELESTGISCPAMACYTFVVLKVVCVFFGLIYKYINWHK